MTKMYRTLRASLLALALPLLGCSRVEPWNVLLVTFDTTRADHFGCYGNTSVRTPNVDALAEEGVRFARAFSTIPLTTPSHSTILTGKYPIAHGVRDNGMFVLPESQETLAEILGAHGWSTGAAIAAFPLTRRFGTDQGFDFYDDHVSGQFENFQGRRALPKASLFFDERRAAQVNEALFPWLEENHQKRFFAWAHYFDPHHPQEPPPPYDQLYAGDLYAGEIAYADESFGNLLDRLKQLGVYDRTLVVLTADHGEGLGEHRELTHSLQLYNTTLHVPLIVKLPGGRAGAVVETPVGTVDILPTILDVLGIEAPEGVQGRSLASDLVDGEESPAEPAALYAETLSPRLGYGWGELRALYSDGHKYIFGPRPELYDLGADPRELNDLVDAEPEIAERLQRQLSRFLRDNAAKDLDAAVDMDEETRNKLMALGYLTGSGDSGSKIEEVLRPGGVAPQDRVADVSDLSMAKQMLFRRQSLPARELVTGLLEEDPDNAYYLELLASADVQLGRLDEALETLQEIRSQDRAGTVTGRLLQQLGTLYLFRGEHDKAEAMLRESQEIQPSAESHYLLANVFLARGQLDEERAALEAALEADPTYAPARVDLAIRQAQAGDRSAAEAGFLKAMRDQPYYPKTYYNYGAFLAEAGELAAAVEQMGRAIELAPRYWQAYVALVQLHLALGEPEAAERHYQTLATRASSSPEAERAAQLIEETS